MWVFVDDSGDCGFKFSSGSSTHVVMAACVFREREHVEHALACVENGRTNRAPDGTVYRTSKEFKYSKAKDSHKDAFFEAMRPAQFAVRAIVLDKRHIHSPYLRGNPRDLKSFLIRQMLTHTYRTVRDAKLVIDGQDTRAFGMSDRDYFLRIVNREAPGTLREVEWADSKKNGLVQLADMVAGSIRCQLDGDEKAAAHFDTYRARTWQPRGSMWHFR